MPNTLKSRSNRVNSTKRNKFLSSKAYKKSISPKKKDNSTNLDEDTIKILKVMSKVKPSELNEYKCPKGLTMDTLKSSLYGSNYKKDKNAEYNLTADINIA